MNIPLTTDIYRRMAAAKMFIEAHYHEPLDLKLVAQQAFLSRFHFHRLFTRIYKRTPHQYITQVRMDAARVLLAKEGINIAEVCSRVGFESVGSFTSLFGKKSGCSPQYYRNIAWLKKRLSQEEPKRFIPHCFIEQYKMGAVPAAPPAE